MIKNTTTTQQNISNTQTVTMSYEDSIKLVQYIANNQINNSEQFINKPLFSTMQVIGIGLFLITVCATAVKIYSNLTSDIKDLNTKYNTINTNMIKKEESIKLIEAELEKIKHQLNNYNLKIFHDDITKINFNISNINDELKKLKEDKKK